MNFLNFNVKLLKTAKLEENSGELVFSRLSNANTVTSPQPQQSI